MCICILRCVAFMCISMNGYAVLTLPQLHLVYTLYFYLPTTCSRINAPSVLAAGNHVGDSMQKRVYSELRLLTCLHFCKNINV